jgi:hypothetical protein
MLIHKSQQPWMPELCPCFRIQSEKLTAHGIGNEKSPGRATRSIEGSVPEGKDKPSPNFQTVTSKRGPI